MRVALFLSGALGYSVLKATLKNSNLKVAVICLAKDGNQQINLRVKKLAHVKKISCIEIDKKPPAKFVFELAYYQIDMIFLAWWPYILTKDMLALPSRCCINLHPGLLPHCRGMDPNFWAVVEQRPFGATLHFANADIDAGDILFQRELKMTWEDTGHTLMRRAKTALLTLFKENLSAIIDQTATSIPQPPGGNLHYRHELVSKIKLDEPTTARELFNFLRARMFDCEPGSAWFTDEDDIQYEVKIQIKKLSRNA
jgi:methionyl-tRNA formyltransferase